MCSFPSSKKCKKSLKNACRFKNLYYLCKRNQGGKSGLQVLKNGALVQLVRIRACHARGQGFESPTHRQKRMIERSSFFVVPPWWNKELFAIHLSVEG